MKRLIAIVALLLAVVLCFSGCSFISDITNRLKKADTNILAAVLSELESYHVELECVMSDGYSEKSEYDVDGAKIYACDGSGYAVVSGDDECCLLPNGNGYARILPDNAYYGYALPVSFFGINYIDTSVFTEDDEGVFLADESDCSEQAKLVLGDADRTDYSEAFTRFEIETDNGELKRAKLKSKIKDGKEVYTAVYTLRFSEIGEVTVKLPSAETVTADEYIAMGLAPKYLYYSNGLFRGTPTVGAAKLLVIPVVFKNEGFTTRQLSNISNAFSATTTVTGWNSVKTYYQTSSYGKLNLSFDVTAPVSLEYDAEHYSSLYEDYMNKKTDISPENVVLEEAIAQLDKTVDFSDYDSDGDGFTDGIYLIYSHSLEGHKQETLWWSWESLSTYDKKVDGVYTGAYVWSGYENITEYFLGSASPNANATTLIHETGHLLGLEDYYDTDYSTGPAGGMGGGDMMDQAVGDHCPASKIKLGWANVKEVTSSKTVTLSAYPQSGDCVVIRKENTGSYGCEYIVIDLYTPTGLYGASSGKAGLPTDTGIRICHVDASCVMDTYENYLPDYFYNNSSTEHKFIKFIEADGRNDIEKADNSFTDNRDIFKTGDTFGSGYSWYDGSALGFTVSVRSLSSGSATLVITFG